MTDKDILILVLGLIGGAITGLVINYFTSFTFPGVNDRINKWRTQKAQKRATQSATKAKARIAKIMDDLERIRRYRNNPIEFNAYGFKFVFVLAIVLIAVLTGNLVVIFMLLYFGFPPNSIIYAVAQVAYMLFAVIYNFGILSERLLFISHVEKYDEYEKEARIQIIELEEVIRTGSERNHA